ncbi:MAG: D-Ala-D-Ala carboxypeptidase family metallohydrolase [Phormidesmis sp.]
MKLITTTDTFLKTLPAQADQLKARNQPGLLIPLKKGTELEVAEYFLCEADPNTKADDHLFVQLAGPLAESQNLRWFVESPAARLEGIASQDKPVPKPIDSKPVAAKPVAAKPVDFGKKIRIPGISRPVGINEPVYHEPIACNFTWSELTAGGTRIPVNAVVTQRIVKLCKYMDGVRKYLGDRPITVTSGYRDPVSNKAVGGVSDSRHLCGDAIDFFVEGMDVVETFNRLKKYHPTGGLAVGAGFVHLDLRSDSQASRWHYAGGPRVDLWG